MFAPQEQLRLPRGVAPIRPETARQRDQEPDRDAAVEAELFTGFELMRSDSERSSHVIEANVHADEIWKVFRALVQSLLPSVSAAIVGIKDDDPYMGPYCCRDDVLAVLECEAEQLVHNGLIEFGMIFQYRGKTEEVFLPSGKYFKIWTSQPDIAVETLARHAIARSARKLRFIDEFTRVSADLPDSAGCAAWPGVIDRIRAGCDALLPCTPPSEDDTDGI